AVFYDGSPCAGGSPIAATLVSGSGLPDNGEALNLTVTLPTPVTLPDQVWLAVEFSTAYAGWIVAEEAETGTTADAFALASYNSGTGQWEWSCNNQISDPSNPHAGFWTHLQCVDAAKGTRGGGGVPTITVTPVDLNGRNVRSAFEPETRTSRSRLLNKPRSRNQRYE
ncbi:MAG: hypothetical protein JXO22_08560, partial [Phycisphaerae bacterium]|nr:hypothetical protein [Phycisphaerae bacterium]